LSAFSAFTPPFSQPRTVPFFTETFVRRLTESCVRSSVILVAASEPGNAEHPLQASGYRVSCGHSPLPPGDDIDIVSTPKVKIEEVLFRCASE
jgi:hypothetical protein